MGRRLRLGAVGVERWVQVDRVHPTHDFEVVPGPHGAVLPVGLHSLRPTVRPTSYCQHIALYLADEGNIAQGYQKLTAGHALTPLKRATCPSRLSAKLRTASTASVAASVAGFFQALSPRFPSQYDRRTLQNRSGVVGLRDKIQKKPPGGGFSAFVRLSLGMSNPAL